MESVTEQEVLNALRQVRDPDKGNDIVSLGMITGMVIRDGNVGFAIDVEPERGSSLEPLRKAAEQAVEILPGVLSVTAVLTAETKSRTAPTRPAAAPAHNHGHAPQGQAPQAHPSQRRGAVPGVGAI